PLHAFLVVFLPDLRPGPSKHVRYFVRDNGTSNHTLREPIHWVYCLNALDKGIRFTLVETADSLECAGHSNRFNKRFGIIEDAFVVEADELARGVAVRSVDLDGLQLV